MTLREKLKDKMGVTDEDFVKPSPQPSAWSRPFWENAKQGRLVLKTCRDCGHIDHPPYLFCTACGSENADWRPAAGRAKVFTFAISEYGVPAPFIEDLPYVMAMIDLPEGPRMIARIVDCDHSQLRRGLEVEVVFPPAREDGFVLPVWRPVDAAARARHG